MKKILIAVFSALLLSSYSESPVLKSGINGIVDPVEGAKKILAINGNDSVSTLPGAGGKFTLDVKPGNWNVWVQANVPFKDVTMSNVMVYENQSTDIGLVTLKQN